MEIVCKIIGSGLVIGGTLYFSCFLNQQLDEKNRQLRRLYSLLTQLKSEIYYMANPLPECFSQLAKSEQEPLKNWLYVLGRRLEQKENETFDQIWEEELKRLCNHSLLEYKEVEPLISLADKLGKPDVSVQLKAIDYALLHIENVRKELEAELKQKKKVVTSLSLFVSALALILLL